MATLTKFGKSDATGPVLRTPAQLDTIGETTMSEQIVSNVQRSMSPWTKATYNELCTLYRLSVKQLAPGEPLHTKKHYSIYYQLAVCFSVTTWMHLEVWKQYGGGQVVWHGYWYEVFPPDQIKRVGNED